MLNQSKSNCESKTEDKQEKRLNLNSKILEYDTEWTHAKSAAEDLQKLYDQEGKLLRDLYTCSQNIPKSTVAPTTTRSRI